MCAARQLDVVLRPADLAAGDLAGRTVVVFDVLRATSSMAAALAAGVREIRVFDDLDAAARCSRDWAAESAEDGPRPILCGEWNCLAPPGFDLGNSPCAFSRAAHAGRGLLMCTTNGTRAIVAASSAATILIGALVNAGAVARDLAGGGSGIMLLCAGTNGAVALEDVIGAGAVFSRLMELATVEAISDRARLALRLFREARGDLRGALADSQGGRNVIAAGLSEDVDYAARLDSLDIVGRVASNPLRVIAAAVPSRPVSSH